MGEAACRGPRERHSPGPNLALNGPDGSKGTEERGDGNGWEVIKEREVKTGRLNTAGRYNVTIPRSTLLGTQVVARITMREPEA